MKNALQATYADIKTVKTRGVCQIVLEMPIEGMSDAIALLGAPVPGNEVWVAIARLRSGAPAVDQIQVPKKGTLAQQAGILCNEPAFWRFLAEETGLTVISAEMAAAEVRRICGVESRATLDRDDEAGRRFRNLKADYQNWLSGLDPAALSQEGRAA